MKGERDGTADDAVGRGLGAAPERPAARLRVLFVMGFPRSGSTLLSRLLDQLEGWSAIGETLDQLYCGRRVHVAPCGCGAEVSECPFWREVLPSLDGDAREFVSRYLRLRYLPLFLAPWRPARMRRLEERFQRAITAMLGDTARRLGAEVLVDSSKLPMYALALARVPGIETTAVHLVRDVRAVAASTAKPKSYLERVTAPRVVFWWTILGSLAEWLLRSGRVRGVRVRYEDLTARPLETVTAISGIFGGAPQHLGHLADGVTELGKLHLLGCNPDKLSHGATRIVARTWSLPRWQRILVTIAGAPLLARFGYLAGAPAAARGPGGEG